jgi:hypothetical protein
MKGYVSLSYFKTGAVNHSTATSWPRACAASARAKASCQPQRFVLSSSGAVAASVRLAVETSLTTADYTRRLLDALLAEALTPTEERELEAAD